MSMTKRWLEDQSVRLGYDGAITPEMLEQLENEQMYEEIHLRSRQLANDEMTPPPNVNECKGCDSQFVTEDPAAEYCQSCASHLSEGESY